MKQISVGIISPNDGRAWVREVSDERILSYENMLVNALESRGVKVVQGGASLPKEEKVIWDTHVVKKHVEAISKEQPDALILNMGDWSWPYDSRDAVQLFANSLKGIDRGIARVILFCYKAPEVPGLVGGMAVAGALKRIGIPCKLVSGKIDQDEKCVDQLMEILEMYHRRREAAPNVVDAIEALKGEKYLAFGGMCMKMCTTTVDVDQWAKIFGVTYTSLDQSYITQKALAMVKWSGVPGKSDVVEILDERVQKALDYQKEHASWDFSRDSLKDYTLFIYQLSYYYASLDIVDEERATFVGIKCQDELAGHECTQCVSAAYLGNNVGPDGCPKDVVPVACENDMDSSLTQRILYHLNGGKPAGFGDFRDIEGNTIAIVNCGQHPPYFFDGPEVDDIEKLNKVEYVGQEHYYRAGGASVRGRTPAGQVMTYARLYRENLRYAMTAVVAETEPVSVEDHKKYSISWPVIKGKVALSEQQFIDLWPCNHMAFTYGDYSAELIEMCERLGIGYDIFDLKGNEYKNIS